MFTSTFTVTYEYDHTWRTWQQ